MPELEEVSAALRRWAGRPLDGEPTAVTGGFDTHIYRFAVDGRRLVLRLYPSISRGPSADREAATLAFLDEAGYPAPALVAHASSPDEFGLPYLIMEEVPGHTALDVIKSRPRQVGRLVADLAGAQAALHALAVDRWPHPVVGDEIDRRIEALGDRRPADPRLAGALDWLRANAAEVRGGEAVVGHFDFHPVNVLVTDDGGLAVIDWENASIGDPHSDLAATLSIFEFAPVVAGSTSERLVLRAAKPWLVRGYRKAYATHRAVDERRLRYWRALHAFDRWWESASLLDGTFDRDTRTDERLGYAGVMAPAMARLFARLVPDA